MGGRGWRERGSNVDSDVEGAELERGSDVDSDVRIDLRGDVALHVGPCLPTGEPLWGCEEGGRRGPGLWLAGL